MKILTSKAVLRAHLQRVKDEPVNVVMTMGALHEGHLALVREASRAGGLVVVTIFINPLQFNDPQDLQRYPRNLDRDAELLREAGVDVLFAPDVEELYPHGDPVVTVSAGAINNYAEGSFRPGHFDGVLTVVTKLLALTNPTRAYFGEKDAQQLIAIKALVRDLDLPVEIVPVPTVRAASGLALSSRNALLSEAERARASALYRALKIGAECAARGAAVAAVVAAVEQEIAQEPSLSLEYCLALSPLNASPVPENYVGEVVLAVAALIGSVRLIDNIRLTIGDAS